ncbi:MAG: T9SS type A sorting domain-containing protein, partial [Ignavibacteriaceae bacterium]|nr:T9SS type A sorting domain-containing protein [Ignavibacteriaceae bacterium]
NPVTKITFTMPETGEVKLTVYNVVGEKVKELINGKLEKGRHSVEFDGRELSSGMYIYRLETDRFSDQKKMILIK